MPAHASAQPPPALARVADRLRCPSCGDALRPGDGLLDCERGHSYDVARQGYVSLQDSSHRGDSAEMVLARERFLAAGRYRPLADAIVAAAGAAGAATGDAGCAIEAGAGTGYYLARMLEARPGWDGVALDVSRPALRRAARAHPRLAAVAADVWQALPLRDGAADLALDVFAPRNGAELARVLAPGGVLVVVTPTPRHLHQLGGLPGMLRVAEEKEERLRDQLGPALAELERREVEVDLRLPRDLLHDLVAMGPSARHAEPEQLAQALAALPEPVTVTASVAVTTFRRG